MYVIGHRGAPGIKRYGENTLTSFQRALECGVDMIEFDVRYARCGTIVVIHDGTIDRTTNGKGRVRDFTYNELREFDAGYGGDHIPSFREVCEIFCGKTRFNIELKERGMVGDVCSVLSRYGILRDARISCFDNDDHEISFNVPSWNELLAIPFPTQKGILASVRKLTHIGSNGYVAYAKELGAEFLHPAKEVATPLLIWRAHREGLKVVPFTVNGILLMRWFSFCGADGIFTDVPELMQKINPR